MRNVIVVCACLVLLHADLAAAQSPGNVPSTGAATNSGYQKGSIGLGVLAGGALPVDLLSARSDRRMSVVAIEIGRIMSERHGDGALAGQFEMLIQIMPIVVRGPADFRGLGMSPLYLRWNFSGTRRVRPFGEMGAGVMLVDWDAAGPGRRRLNFNEQVGVGLRIGAASRAGLVVGYRFQHISNASRSLPSPAVDAHLMYAGFSIVR